MTPRTQNKAAAIVNEDYDSVTHELVHRLEQLGWILVKASGSHLYFSHNKSHWRLHIIKYEGTHRAIKIARISDKNDSISLNLDPTPRDTNDPVVIAKYMSRVPTMSVQARRSWTLDLLANRKLEETSEDQNTMTKIKKGHHRMKSSKKVNEGFWDALVGQTAAAGMQALGQRGLSTKEKLTQNIFIKDFVADAVGALTNAIEGGIVDTSIAPPPESQEVAPSDAAATDATPAAPGNTAQAKPAAPGPAAPGNTAQAKPAAPGPAAPAAPGPAAPGNTAQAKPAAPARPASSRPQATNLDQKYNTVLGSVRKLNTAKGTRPLPASVQTQIQADIQKAKYNKDWAVNTGEKIAALAGRGYNVQGLQQDWIAAQSSGKRQGGVMESYSRLNHLFEQILEATGGQSIEKFMNNWFAKYMSGIDYSGYQDHVDKLIKQIAATYSQDEGVRAITGLAKAAYAISKASGTMPADNKAAAQPADNKPAEQPTNNSNPATKPTTPNNMDLSNLSDSQLSDLLKKAYTEYEMRKRGNKPATGVSESRRR